MDYLLFQQDFPVCNSHRDGTMHDFLPVSTSSSQAKRGPTVVPLVAGTAGLPSDCSAICHQITTIDRAKLADFIGQLPLELLVSIEKALLPAVYIRR